MSGKKASLPLPKQEELLTDYADRLRRHRKGRSAVHLRLSGLKPVNRKAHHLRIAAAVFDPLLKRHDGQIFRLANGDIVFVGKDVPAVSLDDAILKIRYMFREDPFIESVEDSESPESFETRFNIESDYAGFRAMAHALRAECERRAQAVPTGSSPSEAAPAPAAHSARYPLDAGGLARLEKAIETLDLTSVLNRQYVYAILDDAPPQPVFCEYYVSIPAIQKFLMPEYDLRADPWLFQRLTAQLDRRVMHDLPDGGLTVDMPASVNMHVGNILSREFLPFITEVKRRTGKSVLVEIPVADLLEDTHAFTFARDFLRANGQKICIDGMDPMIFRALDRTIIQADLEKVEWSAEYKEEILGPWREGFAKAVETAGAAHMVLCHCDEATAIEFGRSMGIRLFQGRYIDELAAEARPPQTAPLQAQAG